MNESEIESLTTDIAVRDIGTEATMSHGLPQTTASAIIQLALDPAMTPERVEIIRMLRDMQAEEIARQNKVAFDVALAAYQPNKPLIKKTRNLEYPIHKDQPDGPKRFVSKFAKWDEDIDPIVTPLLAQFGFTLHFDISPRTGDSGGLMISAVLEHVQGHTRTYDPVPVPLDTSGGKNLAQSYGSTISYGQRYAAKIAGLIMLEGDDDDGVAAGGSPVTRDQAARLKQLVDDSGIAAGETDLDRKAAVAGWFHDQLNYEIKGYTDVRAEDYPRLGRLLMSLATQRKERAEREMKL